MNGELKEAHVSHLKFYSDSSLETKAIMSHVVSSGTGMQIQRLLRLLDYDEGITVSIGCRGLLASHDTMEPPQQVYDDVPGLLRILLARKNTPSALESKPRLLVGFKRE